jgi:2-polyprenyl-3-methyl-5-hydroxy-6-metoxy-1,4-benzoquinol methylase
VLWKNEEYNNLYRKDQRRIIQAVLEECAETNLVLDIGCGIGVVAKMLTELKPDMSVDAVDFDEMIKVAKECNWQCNINYIASSAEDYYDKEKHYDLIISSGCFSAIRNIKHLEKAMDNCARMVTPSGFILMIDPFHRWNYLARAKYNTRNVVAFMKDRDFSLVKQSGVIFWPYRELLASSKISGEELRQKYEQGEKILRLLGEHFWADYKVLLFKK